MLFSQAPDWLSPAQDYIDGLMRRPAADPSNLPPPPFPIEALATIAIIAAFIIALWQIQQHGAVLRRFIIDPAERKIARIFARISAWWLRDVH